MAKFGTFLFGEETFGGASPTEEFQNLVRVPWIFKDVVNDEEYEFAVNPLDTSIPSVEKSVATQYTTAGKAINFEGRSKPQTINFSGTILTEQHLNAMNYWFEKSSQINLSDDLGRKYWIVITNFAPTRQYTPDFPWRHEYSADAIILSWS